MLEQKEFTELSSKSNDNQIPDVTFWYLKDKNGDVERGLSEQEFAPKLTKIGSCNSLPQFWAIYQHIRKPSDCKGCDFQIFKQGIMPMWEDPHNKEGGKFSVLLVKEVSSIVWEEVVFSFCGGVIPHYDEINGIAISTRKKFYTLQIWFKDYERRKVDEMRKNLKLFFQIPFKVNMEVIIKKKKNYCKN